MARWTHSASNEKYAVAIFNFDSAKQFHLSLEIGETVFILRQLGGWYYGYSLRNKDIRGIFPKSHVVLKDASVDYGGLQSQGHDRPLADEINSVLREWCFLWKKRFVQSVDASESDLKVMYNMMVKLAENRKLILSKTLPKDELKALQQTITFDIDVGNKKIGLDFVVRDNEGNILDPFTTSTINLFRQHQAVAKRLVFEKKRSVENLSNNGKVISVSLLVSIKNFVCKTGDDVDLFLALYDAKTNIYITENFFVHWVARKIGAISSSDNDVLFTDLGQKDVLRERIMLVCQIVRTGQMKVDGAETKKLARDLKRPFGVAVLDVTEVFNGAATLEKDSFVPVVLCGDSDTLDAALKKLLANRECSQRDQGLWLTVKLLFGDSKQAIKENPHIISHSAVIAKKMGFPDIISPGDMRNDLYVTLCEAEFKKGMRVVDKNIEVTAVACNSSGHTLEKVIIEGAGSREKNSYRSVVYYHDNKPKWNETFKVSIPISDFINAHMKFTFRHRSSFEAKDKAEKLLAVAYINLMLENGTTLPDGAHNLAIYSTDGRRIDDSLTYLQLPSTLEDLEKLDSSPVHRGHFKLSKGNSFTVSTLLCSTKLANNVDLLRLLKWREHPEQLRQGLQALMKVGADEIMKFLEDVLDVLFSILMQFSDSDEYDSLVFDALNYILNIVLDRKYLYFRPVLDAYITDNFSATLAYNKLLAVLKANVTSALRGQQTSDSLMKALTSFEYIIKFIVRSRVLYAAINNGQGKQQFESSLTHLFDSLNLLMVDKSDASIAMQEAALKYLPITTTNLLTVWEVSNVASIMMRFITSIPPEKLKKQKLLFVDDIIRGPLFLLPEGRSAVLSPIMNLIQRYLEDGEELELCAKILSDVLDLLSQLDILETAADIEVIIMSTFRAVIQVTIGIDRVHSASLAGSYVAIIIDILRQMVDHHYTLYLSHFETKIDLLDFLTEILMVFRDLTSKSVFPPDWTDIILLQSNTFAKALKFFAKVIVQKFLNPFEYQVWNNYFHCSISFITQDSLQVEHFSAVKRNKILQKYGDMRREIAIEVTKMWQSLNANKIEFIPDLVGPFLDMTLIPEMELRKETLPLFFDMMHTEFHHQSRFSFRQFENELIMKLDLMMEGGKGDDLYPDLFRSIITGRLEHHLDMRKVGTNFVDSVCQLMQNLLEYRAVMAGDNIELKISSTVNLLNFYESLKRQEVYMRYLHKLCDFHLNAQNFTEAACTLQQYARLLRWSDDEVPLTLQSQQFPDMSTQRELKLKLYHAMVDYFDRGQMWENGIELCKELAEQYEKQTIDYLALSSILQKQATFFDNIMKQNRGEPCYFRVAYYGLGFPAFMQNKAYVYRGSNWERLSDFTANIQNLYPNAKLLNTLGNPDDTVKFSDRQYLQVNAVTPIMKLPAHLEARNKPIHEQVTKYYQVNQVQTFMYARRKDESTNDITKLWLEKTYLTISNPLPNILRWYPIVKIETADVSPIENAIETLEGTNQKLTLLIKEHMKDVSLRVDPLGMVLNGVVDAAVNGGIANYRPFYQANYVETHPADAELVKQLRQMTIRQLVLVQAGLEIHRQRAPDALLPFQARMDQRFNEMKAHMEADYDISLTDDIRTTVSKKIGIPVSMKRSKIVHTPQRHADNDHAAAQGSSDKHQPRLLNAAHSMVASAIGSRSSAAAPLSRAATTAVPTHAQGHEGRGFKVFHRSHNTSSVASPPAATVASVTTVTTSPAASADATDSSAKTTPTSSTGGDKTRSERLIELTQQLTPKRPPRPSSAKVPTSRASLGLLSDLTADGRGSSLALAQPASENGAVTSPSSSSGKQAGDKPALPRKPRHFLTVQVQPQHLAFLTDQSNAAASRPLLPQKQTLVVHKPDQPETLL